MIMLALSGPWPRDWWHTARMWDSGRHRGRIEPSRRAGKPTGPERRPDERPIRPGTARSRRPFEFLAEAVRAGAPWPVRVPWPWEILEDFAMLHELSDPMATTSRDPSREVRSAVFRDSESVTDCGPGH